MRRVTCFHLSLISAARIASALLLTTQNVFADDAKSSKSDRGPSAIVAPSIALAAGSVVKTLYSNNTGCALANVDIWFVRNSYAYTFYLAGFDGADSSVKLKDETGASVFYRERAYRELIARRPGDDGIQELPQKIADLDGVLTYFRQPGSVQLGREAADQSGSTILLGADGCRQRLRIERMDGRNAMVPPRLGIEPHRDPLGRIDYPYVLPKMTGFRPLYQKNAGCRTVANLDIWFAQGQHGYTLFVGGLDPAQSSQETADGNGTTVIIGASGCRFRVQVQRSE
jgi:hypothetical protein